MKSGIHTDIERARLTLVGLLDRTIRLRDLNTADTANWREVGRRLDRAITQVDHAIDRLERNNHA